MMMSRLPLGRVARIPRPEMKPRPSLSRTLSGIAGEYFVAAELTRRGYVASLTLRNTRGIDILASNADATKSVGIQVKTNQGSKQARNPEALRFLVVFYFTARRIGTTCAVVGSACTKASVFTRAPRTSSSLMML